MSTQVETWKVICPDGTFETDLGTLQEWIAEGIVHPNDQVSKGNLRWIDAYKVPLLRPIFDGEKPTILPNPPAVPDPVAGTPQPVLEPEKTHTLTPLPVDTKESDGPRSENLRELQPPASSTGAACRFHPESAADFICRVCSHIFCKPCIKFIGSSRIAICPDCGDLCAPISEVQERSGRQQLRSSAFGFGDLGESIAYPFRHLIALIFGAGVYGFFLLGGLRTQVLAWAVLFGCIVQAINHVAVGRMRRSFLPDFSAFDMWDDVIKPAFLGIGVTIVTLGPAIALVGVMLWHIFAAAPPASQNVQLKPLTTQDFNEMVATHDENKKSEEIAKKIQAMNSTAQIADPVQQVEQNTSPAAIMSRLLTVPGWLIGGIVLSILWAFLYYPMAIAVAGYTESFKATINPFIGIDTMRRMGGTFARAFGMYMVLQVIGMILIVIVSMLTAPFNLPMIGNLPGTFLNGVLTFYLNLVIACLMGLALFKSADRLGIATD